MKTLSTYRVHTPTTASGYSITISTTIFGTEEEIEYLRKNCEENIGSGLVQEYSSPVYTSLFKCVSEQRYDKTSTNIAFDIGGHTYGVMGGDKIMAEFEKDLRGDQNDK